MRRAVVAAVAMSLLVGIPTGGGATGAAGAQRVDMRVERAPRPGSESEAVVRVTAADAPIAGAHVRFAGRSGLTDTGGRVRFRARWPALLRRFPVHVTADGFAAAGETHVVRLDPLDAAVPAVTARPSRPRATRSVLLDLRGGLVATAVRGGRSALMVGVLRPPPGAPARCRPVRSAVAALSGRGASARAVLRVSPDLVRGRRWCRGRWRVHVAYTEEYIGEERGGAVRSRLLLSDLRELNELGIVEGVVQTAFRVG